MDIFHTEENEEQKEGKSMMKVKNNPSNDDQDS